ncbi:DNA cytosine methyltransferase [Nodularia sp. NIES-3585]|uniref:DNA cytosine methyltransferase n=1 Tax=Nodularia sp. NIES-3585 TaxID=1973477 RepID=UPI000B5CCE75|nr:DNA cytosine methyltransferase [Nodularia sp. NIES-3585]GAX37488.1 site-specific DNA-methyltransferase [Nodularia sp. NIES-3585]
MKTEQLVAIDLFAGAGGFSLGFEMAGFSIPLSVEIDSWACDTLRYNHPEMTVIQNDIREFNTLSSVKQICPYKPDIIIGGPPCQGFSIAGPAQKEPNDPRNTLFINFAQWITFLDPKAFVMENVKGLLSRKNSENVKVIDIIKKTFAEMGYFIELWVLNSAEYGVPQIRERVFIVGNKLGKKIGAPPKTHSLNLLNINSYQLSFGEIDLIPAIKLWDAISDLPLLNAREGQEEQPLILESQNYYQNWIRNGSQIVYNHVAMEHSQRLVERFKQIKWGQSSSDVPKEYGAKRRSGNGELSHKNYDQNNRRLNPYKPAHTIAASFYANFIHPFQHRNLTAREGARIQSFPDTYRFLGKKTVVSHKLLQRENRLNEKFLCQYNQIGNAVPPLLAKAIAVHLKEKLELCP